MSSKRRSRQEWRDLIARWQSSGVSATAFCAEHDINLAGFYKKRRELSTGSQFVPVRVREQGVVVQVGEVGIRCSTATPVSWIADLVAALRP